MRHDLMQKNQGSVTEIFSSQERNQRRLYRSLSYLSETEVVETISDRMKANGTIDYTNVSATVARLSLLPRNQVKKLTNLMWKASGVMIRYSSIDLN